MAESFDETEGINTQGTEIETATISNPTIKAHAAMLKEIRHWGLWSLGLGVLHIISSGFLSAPWGILLLVVGLASFYFQTASIFIIYAVTLVWAALSNLSGFDSAWALFALLQVSFAVSVIKQYQQFRNIEAEYSKLAITDTSLESASMERAARFFPWAGSLLGCSSIIGLLATVVVLFAIVIGSEDIMSMPDYLAFMLGIAFNFGVLGFAIGLASLLSRYRPKVLAIIGIVAGVLVLLAQLALFFL